MSRTAIKWSPVGFPPKPWPKRPTLSDKHWRECSEFYRRNKNRLLKDPRYNGKYVAIRHKRVVDVDTDKVALANRLFERFPDHLFFVKHVLKIEPVIELGDLVFR